MANNFTIGGLDLESAYITDQSVLDPYIMSGSAWAIGGAYVAGTSGTGSTVSVNYSSPVQVLGSPQNWVYLSGSLRNMAGIKSDGTLWMWGDNQYGQAGNNTVSATVFISSPIQTIAGGTNWKQVAYSRYSVRALKTDGTLWAWGYNSQGELGTGDVTNRSSPTQVGTEKTWMQIGGAYQCTFGIKTNGTLWVWGGNGTAAELGTGNASGTLKYSSPVQQYSSTNWASLQLSGFDVHGGGGIKTDGTLWLWGSNSYGQIGNNATAATVSSPTQTVAGGTNWKQLALGWQHAIGLKTDGTLWLWGRNSSGQLGDGTSTHRSSPVQTAVGGTNWKVAVASTNTAATPVFSIGVKTDGTLWSWGGNTNGQLGIGTTVSTSTPVQVGTLTSWKSVTSQLNASLGLQY